MMHGANGLTIERDNQIMLAQTGAFRGAVLFDRSNEHTGLKGQSIKTNDPSVNWHVLTGNTDVTAPDLSVFDQPSGHKFRCVAGDGEANALRRPDHRRVYAYNFTSRIDQWATRVTGI